MPATYEPIATTTLGSAAASYTFNSISGSYTDLVVIAVPNTTVAADIWMQVNGDTGSNYSTTQLTGTGSSAASYRSSNRTNFNLNVSAYMSSTGNQNYLIQIQNYSNTTTYKTIIGRANNASLGVDATVGLWRNTAAITSVTLLNNGSTFASGSTFTLYGIKSA